MRYETESRVEGGWTPLSRFEYLEEAKRFILDLAHAGVYPGASQGYSKLRVYDHETQRIVWSFEPDYRDLDRLDFDRDQPDREAVSKSLPVCDNF